MSLEKDLYLGPVSTARDYQFRMQDPADPTKWYDLSCPSFDLGEPEYDETDPLRIAYNCFERGRRVSRQQTVLPSTVREITRQIGFPQGRWLTGPVHKVAGKNCPATFASCYNCPPNTRDGHFFVYRDAIVDQIKPTTKAIEAAETGEPIVAQAAMRVPVEDVYWTLQVQEVQTEAQDVNAVVFEYVECPGCADIAIRGLYGGAANTLKRTTDGFASGTALTTGLTGAAVIHDIYSDGNLIIILYTDGLVDGIRVSLDGTTFSEATITNSEPLNHVIRAGRYFVVVGENGAIFRSTDALTWTAVPNTGSLAAADFNRAAYDRSSGKVFIAGDNGASAGFAAVLSGNSLADITADVGAAADELYAVAVLRDGHVAFAGEDGAFYENFATEGDGTWTSISVGAADIKYIGGNNVRTIVAGGDLVWERSACTEGLWDELVEASGTSVTGNYIDGDMDTSVPGVNRFVLSTDADEIVIVQPDAEIIF